jgi:hypothetical protein
MLLVDETVSLEMRVYGVKLDGFKGLGWDSFLVALV